MTTAWREARKILCVRLDNMGDVLMTSPAMQALKDSGPNRHLTLLTSSGAAPVASHLPMVDAVLTWDAPWVKGTRGPLGRGSGATVQSMAQRLQDEGFDAAVIFTVYSQSPLPAALLCTMAGIPLRLAHCRENPYQMLSDWVPETEPQQQIRHEVQRQLDLVATVGATAADERMRFRVQPHDRRAVQRRIDALRATAQGPCVVMHAGATAESRQWPADRFAQAARQLATEQGALVLLTGGQSEQPLVESVRDAAAHPAVVSVAGELTLGQMGALLDAADLLISNNSGPVHLAAALGTPVVDLYALTNPQHTPWMVPHRTLFADVPCRYCYKSVCPQQHHRCLRDVEVAQVCEAAVALLAGAQPAPDALPALTLADGSTMAAPLPRPYADAVPPATPQGMAADGGPGPAALLRQLTAPVAEPVAGPSATPALHAPRLASRSTQPLRVASTVLAS
ncbi:lipopolysaccharide heptosyltransferase II [Cupriavidus sp. AU9028]|uniref:lipopolysaccharide heptosyltransferase II n=1 Tax=Cupriavidus sp. AU9028 TaxID=2871157 RepID=UPI001C979287|nr:lipopolysaccharide heptosyltransferase II [Cupriavidus sp. AU9028]MBY4896085.1 lipopolysaccharide heptosyltransferase II [Cupriavidus sp. AU9028]